LKEAPLSHALNLGPKSEAMLRAAGISNLEELKSLGSVAAYARVKSSGVNASLNLLWALEGAVSGLHWRVVAREHRTSLLLALEEHAKREA
jgi:TfoX/Sxy family transcriptional regulator of competence genes